MQEKLRTHIEKIISLTDDEFSIIHGFFTTAKFKKKEFLIREGKSVTQAYFVLSGLLKLTFMDNSGKHHIVSFAMEDWWESDFPAYFNQTKATMSLQCLEDTEVYCLSFENYQKLCTDFQKMQSFLLKKSNLGFIAAQQRILSLITTNAKERYEQLLQLHPTLFQRVSKTQLAAYLGVSRETLSRLSS
ncbi:Crp/Fnr family transcriptional regulator [Flavobacterium piscis]|uniref:CRP-like cAMP-binding protein n=1 Tax=Flavobacterium piscis TaxID=1114874 RepID=A0ABU1YCT3_9FLAO|nr:Crp/Fnr family transcriptional regulator [Flavobacterium piscis]MDR7211231.1 CRP-like cAMP-binding protein [Flavobacterium piscis]